MEAAPDLTIEDDVSLDILVQNNLKLLKREAAGVLQ